MASSFLATTADVAASCAAYWSIVMPFLPASLHFLDRAVRSSTCTVPFCTATLCPQASSGLMPLGLPFCVAHWVPAEKQLNIAASSSLSALIVNDETPTSNLPAPTFWMRVSNGAVTHFVL